MELNRPYGESAEDLERAEDKQARREVAVRLVAQAMDTCAMCACALDSAFMDGRPMPDGIYHEHVTEAVKRALLQAARELWCIMETLDANAKKADECAALLGEVAELLRGGNNEAR